MRSRMDQSSIVSGPTCLHNAHCVARSILWRASCQACPTATAMKRFLGTFCHRTLNLRSLAVLLVIVALVLALAVQQRKAAVRERALRSALLEARAIRAADERMRGLFGDRGVSILKT